MIELLKIIRSRIRVVTGYSKTRGPIRTFYNRCRSLFGLGFGVQDTLIYVRITPKRRKAMFEDAVLLDVGWVNKSSPELGALGFQLCLPDDRVITVTGLTADECREITHAVIDYSKTHGPIRTFYNTCRRLFGAGGDVKGTLIYVRITPKRRQHEHSRPE